MNEHQIKYIQGSLFGEIQLLNDYAFFADHTPLEMDKLLRIYYGERILFSPLRELTAGELANILVNKLNDTWDKLIIINSINPNAEVITLDEKVDNSEVNTGSNTLVNTISAFNSDDLVNNDGSNGSNTNTKDGERNRLSTQEKINAKDAYLNFTASQKFDIVESVLNSVVNQLALTVY